MLFIRNKEYLKESSQKIICDGYSFKLYGGVLEVLDITYKVNKEDYIKSSIEKFGSGVTMCLRYQVDELVGHNIEGLKHKIQRYFSQRNLKPLNFSNNTDIPYEDEIEPIKETLTLPVEENSILDFNNWRNSFYKDINVFIFIVDKEFNLTLGRWQKLDLDSIEFENFKNYCKERFTNYILAYLIDEDIVVEPFLNGTTNYDLDLKELVKNYFLDEYQLYLKNYS